MLTEGEYTCDVCGETFSTNVAIAGHTRAHQSTVSREELLRDLKRLASEKGRTPTRNEYDEEGDFSSFPVSQKFGSWNEGVKAAGLEPNVEFEVSKETVIRELRTLAASKGRSPTTQDMTVAGKYSPTTVQRTFGSWQNALQAAGLEPTLYTDVSDEELIDSMHELREELGNQPTATEMDELGRYSTKIFQRRFGTWNEALRAAGYQPIVRHNIPESELRSDIVRVAEQLGRGPSKNEYGDLGEYSTVPYIDRFGDWPSAVRWAGYEPRGYPRGPDNPLWKGGHPDSYGPNWCLQRKQALERDKFRCQAPGCGMTNEDHREQFSHGIEVHHIVPLRFFSRDDNTDEYEGAHDLRNLITLCRTHHLEWEKIAPLRPDTRHL